MSLFGTRRQASPRPRRRRLAPPEERALAREVARFAIALDEPNLLCALMFVHATFPGIALETALAGVVFRKILAQEPDQVLH
jgi:hypothetical protein